MHHPRCWLALLCLCLVMASSSAAQNVPPFAGLTIRRSGGFGGGEEEWYFSEEGVRWTAAGIAVQTPAEKVFKLKKLVSLKCRAHQSQPVLIPVCSDCFTFRIIVWYDDGQESFELDEAGGGTLDAETKEMLRLIRELIGSYPPKP